MGRGVLGCNSTRGHFWWEKDGREGNAREIRKANQLKWIRVITTVVDGSWLASNSSSIAHVSLPLPYPAHVAKPTHTSAQHARARARHDTPRLGSAAGARTRVARIYPLSTSLWVDTCVAYLSWVNNQSKSRMGLKLYCITTFNMGI
jgi:hypothetical protein